jgi:chitosanase
MMFSKYRIVLTASILLSVMCVSLAQRQRPIARRPTSTVASSADLFDPAKKEIAMQLVTSAENSSLDWKAQYGYIEYEDQVGDNRGYTGGIIGFTSRTGDMLDVVKYYTSLKPDNALAKYILALQRVEGTSSREGLDPNFTGDWQQAANDPLFRKAQDWIRDTVYFNPAVTQAKADGLRALGQFIYYDAMVMHGPGSDRSSFDGIRKEAIRKAKPPAQNGDEKKYLSKFLDVRKAVMRTEEAHSDTSRVDTAQRLFLQDDNFDLNPPLSWKVYGASYQIP